jgi:hypothetical protein
MQQEDEERLIQKHLVGIRIFARYIADQVLNKIKEVGIRREYGKTGNDIMHLGCPPRDEDRKAVQVSAVVFFLDSILVLHRTCLRVLDMKGNRRRASCDQRTRRCPPALSEEPLSRMVRLFGKPKKC